MNRVDRLALNKRARCYAWGIMKLTELVQPSTDAWVLAHLSQFAAKELDRVARPKPKQEKTDAK